MSGGESRGSSAIATSWLVGLSLAEPPTGLKALALACAGGFIFSTVVGLEAATGVSVLREELFI